MAVVTISGRIGAPVRAVGLEVARGLGAEYIDYQILIEASKRIGTSLAEVAQKDERVARGRERISKIIQRFVERSAAAGSAGDPLLGPTGIEVLMSRSFGEAARAPQDRDGQLDDELYIGVMTTVLKEMGAAGNAVIIGRGSNIVLKDLPGAVHTWLVTALPARTTELMRRERLSECDAQKYIKSEEEARAAYYKKFFKVAADDPNYYDLFLNINRLGADRCAQLIVAATCPAVPAPVLA